MSDQQTPVDFDVIEETVIPNIVVDAETLRLVSTDGTTTVCNLYTVNVTPVVFIIEPVLNQSIMGVLTARVSAIDPDLYGSIERIEYKIDQGLYKEVAITPARGQDVVFPVEASAGSRLLTVRVTDNRGTQATASVTFSYNDGQQVSVRIQPQPIVSGQDYDLDIFSGIPDTQFTVQTIQGPSSVRPADGTLNAAGAYHADVSGSGLLPGSYLWRFTFANNVIRDMPIVVEAVRQPQLSLDDYDLTTSQPVTISIVQGQVNETWTLTGSAGVTGSLITGGDGSGQVIKTPSQSGTIIATSGSQVLTVSVNVAAPVGAKISVTSNPTQSGQDALATITGSVEGRVYTLNGTSGSYTASILIGSDGSGSTIVRPAQTGTVTATSSQDTLSTTVTVVAKVYTPLVTVKRLAEAAWGYATLQTPVTDTLMFKLTGAKPNTMIDKVVVGSQELDLWVQNVGGTWLWTWKDSDVSQPPNTVKAVTDSNGEFNWRWVDQSSHPFWDRDYLNVPPVDADLTFKLQDQTVTNSISIRWARTFQLKAVNATVRNLSIASDPQLVGASNSAFRVENSSYYSNVLDTSFEQEVVYLVQNANPAQTVQFAVRFDQNFVDSDFADAQIYSRSPADRGQPTLPLRTDNAGGAFYNICYSDPKYSGKTLYIKYRTSTNQSNVLTFRLALMSLGYFNTDWIASKGLDVSYNPADPSQNYIIDKATNNPDNWLPTAIGLRKVPNLVDLIRFNIQGGSTGDKIYYSFNGTNWTDTGAVLDANLYAFAGVTFRHNDYTSGQVVRIYLRVGSSMQIRNVTTVTMTGSAVTPPSSNPVITYPQEVDAGTTFNWSISNGPLNGSFTFKSYKDNVLISDSAQTALNAQGNGTFTATGGLSQGSWRFDFLFSDGVTRTSSLLVKAPVNTSCSLLNVAGITQPLVVKNAPDSFSPGPVGATIPGAKYMYVQTSASGGSANTTYYMENMLIVPEEGTYTCKLTGDDNTKLLIDCQVRGTQTIGSDGSNPLVSTFTVYLTAGQHFFQLVYQNVAAGPSYGAFQISKGAWTYNSDATLPSAWKGGQKSGLN